MLQLHKNLKILLCLFALGLQVALGYEREMTVSVDAGKRECFYESLKADQIIDIGN